jgi:MipA family protein
MHVFRISTVSALLVALPLAASADELRLKAGGAMLVTPKYEGSKDYEVRGFPIVAPDWSDDEKPGIIQFYGPDEVRARLLSFNGFEAGPVVGYRFGRDEDDADRLDGLGDVDDGLLVGAYAAYDFNGVKPFVSFGQQVTGDSDGALTRFGIETRVPVAYTTGVRAIVGASYADDDYMQDYFGITAAQAAASTAGLTQYEASAGIKDVFLDLSTNVPLTDQWSMMLNGRYSHLTGDATDSPIVETESQFTSVLGFTYRFSVDR